MNSQLAVLMFADVVGYSALMEEDHSAAMEVIRALKFDYLEPHVADHDGQILKRMGDGWIIMFPTVSASVRCATKVQTGLAGQSRIRLRIGCHVGEVVADDDDYYGGGLNIAQRIQTEAPPGGFMISEDLFRQLPTVDRAVLKDAGTFQLKNISQPVRLYQWRPARGRPAHADEVPSIAVMAMEFAPNDDDTRALAGDMRDQLLTRLSRRVGVAVFDDEPAPPASATYLLRSRLRIATDRGRLSVSLVLRSENRPLWSMNYDAQVDDVIEFCDQLLDRAEGDLRIQTNAFDGDRLAAFSDDELSVSELRARAANNFFKPEFDAWQYGLKLMQRAIDLNPQDGVSLAMHGEAQDMLHGARYEAIGPDLLARLQNDLDTAIEQAPRSDYVFWVRGVLRVAHFGDVDGALSDLNRSRSLNAGYFENYELEGDILMAQARYGEAARAYSWNVGRGATDPLQAYRLCRRAMAHLFDRNFDAAIEDTAEGCNLRPKDRGLRIMRVLASAGAIDLATARVALNGQDIGPFQPSVVSSQPVTTGDNRWFSQIMGPDGARSVDPAAG